MLHAAALLYTDSHRKNPRSTRLPFPLPSFLSHHPPRFDNAEVGRRSALIADYLAALERGGQVRDEDVEGTSSDST